MPQLDKFSFATQLFWFCSFFILYYVLVTNKLLPNFFKILRFRFFRLKLFSTGVRNYLSEELLIISSYTNIIIEKFFITSKIINNLNRKYLNWINKNKSTFLI